MKTYAELTKHEIEVIRDAVDQFITDLSAKISTCTEAVATVAFYRMQRHPSWGRNATTTQKNASYKHWKGVCHRCKEKVARSEAKFHHIVRGLPDQHGPKNLVPEHTACHDDEHNVVYGSLSKGSPTKKTKLDSAG
jgi:hypothetical protein